MPVQNLKNHSRYVPLHHIIVPLLIVALLVGSIINLNDAINKGSGRLNAAMFCLISPILVLIWWYARLFALRAHDKAIRAEESLRYFAITGSLPDSKLTMGQFVALRFAPNNEFVSLAHRAVEENLKPSEIKKAIQHWKEDNNRV